MMGPANKKTRTQLAKQWQYQPFQSRSPPRPRSRFTHAACSEPQTAHRCAAALTDLPSPNARRLSLQTTSVAIEEHQWRNMLKRDLACSLSTPPPPPQTCKASNTPTPDERHQALTVAMLASHNRRSWDARRKIPTAKTLHKCLNSIWRRQTKIM